MVLVDDLGNGGLLLADGDVDAVNALPLLVDDGVDGNRGLAGLAVADDELALTAAHRDHGVDGLEAGLQRLMNRFARHDAGRLDLDLAGFSLDAIGPFARRWAGRARRPRGRPSPCRPAPRRCGRGAPNGVAFAGRTRILAHEGDADVVLLEVEHQPLEVSGEFEELSGHHSREAVDAGDAVAGRKHGAGLGDLDRIFP